MTHLPSSAGLGRKSRFWDRTLPVLTVLLIGFIVSYGVFFPVMHFGHSAHIDLIRQIEVNEAYDDGYVYPRWVADFYFGRGSPIFNFYAPLVYLIGEFFCLLGLTPLYAVKAVYIFFVILAGYSMYLLAREVWGVRIGVACAALYMLSPYLLVDLYVRSALAELSGFAWLPLSMFYLLHASRRNSRLDAAVAAAAVALLCLSHNITAMLGIAILVFWCFVVKDRAPLRRTLFAVGLGMMISSFFWFPALAEKGYINAEANLTLGDYSYTNSFVSLRDLVSTKWGFGSAMRRGGEVMSTQIGLVHLVLLIPGLAWLALSKKWKIKQRAFTGFLCIGFASLFFTNVASKAIWDHLPLLRFVQFPFRFLLPATLGLTGAAGAAAHLAGERLGVRGRAWTSYFIVLAALLFYGPYIKAHYLLHDRQDPNRMIQVTREQAMNLLGDQNIIEAQDLLTPWVLRETRESKSTALDDYLPVWVKEKPTAYFGERAEAVDGTASIEPHILRQTGYAFQIRAATAATVLVHTFYFPGWTARIGEHEMKIDPDDRTGEITFRLPPGIHDVVVEFEDTKVRLLSKMASLLGLIALIGVIGVENYRRSRDAPAVPLRKSWESVSTRIRRSRDRRRPLRRHRPAR